MKKMKDALVLGCVTFLIIALALLSMTSVGGGKLNAENIHLGLDLAGGVSITYQAAEGTAPSEHEMDGALSVIQRRLDKKGYTEATAYLDGSDRIRVEIPGVEDANEAVEEIGRTAMLRFVGVDLEALLASDIMEEYYDQYVKDVREIAGDGNISVAADNTASADTYQIKVSDLPDETIRQNGQMYFAQYTVDAFNRYPELLDRAIEAGFATESLDGTMVKNASYQKGETGSQGIIQSYVRLELNDQGTEMFADITAQYLKKYVAILLDDTMISMPTVSNVITNGDAVITNNGSDEEAKALADDIVGGALPVELVDIEHQAVGATLGRDALDTSIKAGIIGFIIIIVFLFVFYKVPGIAASISLLGYVSLELLLINAFGWTLTLAGIAGFILSIGMAVDANIIIFSRITEELNLNHTLRVSVRTGFRKALPAILDGNITTMIAALVLYFAGSGTIKGFAQTLGLGIVLSMFCALLITRMLLTSMVSILPEKRELYHVLKLRKKEEK